MQSKPVIAAILLSNALWAQSSVLDKVKGVGRGGKASETKSAPGNEGTLQRYVELRAFAEGLYSQVQGDGTSRRGSDFKRRVDTAYEESRKGDMQRAYEMNLSAKSETRQVMEDRFRVYSGLYDNPVLQTLTNLVGQSMVPPQISRHYTFKLVADPVPWAESLSTGSVWVSTGLVAMLDSKAQLCYVLAHEASHVYLGHHRQRLMLEMAEQEQKKQLDANKAEETSKKDKTNKIVQAVGQVELSPAFPPPWGKPYKTHWSAPECAWR